MYKLRIINVLIYLTIIKLGNAQNAKWILEKCIVYAKENNLQIKQAGYDVGIARTNQNTSEKTYLTDINAYAIQQYYLNLIRSVNSFAHIFSNINNTSSNFLLTGSLELFKGFQRKYDV